MRNWKRVFVESGREGLERGMGRRSSREFELAAENEEIKAALGEAHVQLRVLKKGAQYLPPSRSPGMIRADAGLRVPRFCVLVGVPRRSYQRLLARLRAGDPGEGPVAGAGGGPHRAGGGHVRLGVARLGLSHDPDPQ